MLSLWCSKKEFMTAPSCRAAAGIVAAISASQTDSALDIPCLRTPSPTLRRGGYQGRSPWLVGIRPTVGLVSRTGMVPLNSVRDTAGAMARSVSDMAILLDVIVGHDPEDSATTRAEGHRSPTYSGELRSDALK